jgi:hypothetical protein
MPESIEHYSAGTEDCVGSLSRYDLKPLKIIKHGTHRPDRGISGVAGGPTMTYETIQIASSQSAAAMPCIESHALRSAKTLICWRTEAGAYPSCTNSVP